MKIRVPTNPSRTMHTLTWKFYKGNEKTIFFKCVGNVIRLSILFDTFYKQFYLKNIIAFNVNDVSNVSLSKILFFVDFQQYLLFSLNNAADKPKMKGISTIQLNIRHLILCKLYITKSITNIVVRYIIHFNLPLLCCSLVFRWSRFWVSIAEQILFPRNRI